MKQVLVSLGLINGKLSAFIFLFNFSLNLFGSELPQNKYLEAYNAINEGDKYFANQEWALADEKYFLAMKILKKINEDFPDWDPTLVDYRLKDTRKKIKIPLKKEKEGKATAETLEENSADYKNVLEINILSRVNMPFDEKEILNLIPVKAGDRIKSGEAEKWKQRLLATGRYKSVEIKEINAQDARGEQAVMINILFDPNISQKEIEAYFEKSRHPEKLTPKKTWWGKYCYINQDGIDIIPPVFEEAYPFEGKYACVKQNGKYGLINSNGEFVVSAKYNLGTIKIIVFILRILA